MSIQIPLSKVPENVFQLEERITNQILESTGSLCWLAIKFRHSSGMG